MNPEYPTKSICPICWEPYEAISDHDLVKLNCQHAFGRKCITYWAGIKLECPLCRHNSFPAELTGGQTGALRRLANRTIFIPDPFEHSTIRSFSLGVGVGVSFTAGVVAINSQCNFVNSSQLILPLIVNAGIYACLSAIRGNVSGTDTLCNYYAGYSAGLILSALFVDLFS